MKTLICIAAIVLLLFVVGTSSVQSQVQVVDGYTFIRGVSGTLVCLGKWVPSRDVAIPGYCDGETLDINQLTAISSRMTADRLDQILNAIYSLDQKLATNNDQIKQLIETNVKTQASIDDQVRQVSNLLSEKITERFNALPEAILANDLFKKEIEKLKVDILKEVEKHYSIQSTPSTR
jgi:hypothetical protein